MAEDNNSTYLRLTLSGVKSKKDGNDLANMDLRYDNEITSSQLTLDTTTYDLSVTPKYIYFHRKIGEHNTIKTEFEVLVSTTQGSLHGKLFFALTTFFKSNDVTLHRCHYDTSGGTKTEVIDTKERSLAQKYRVINSYPTFKSNDAKGYSFLVTLEIASWDFVMSQTKYSRAYTARKLGEDILKPLVRKIWNLSKPATANDTDAVDNYCNTKGLRNLYPTIGTYTFEVMQPYLVQYNETEYDFLLRNANRCGEYFYFEDGKIYLGLQKDNTTPKDLAGAQLNAVHSDICSDEGASLFYQNAFKKTSSSTPGSSAKPFVAGYANDDYFDPIQKSGYDDQESWEGLNPDTVYRVFSEIFQMDTVDMMSIFDVVNNSVLKVKQVAKTFSKKSNDAHSDKYFKNTKADATKSQYSDDDDYFAQFSDIYSKKSKKGDIPTANQPSTTNTFNRINGEIKMAWQQYSFTEKAAGNSYWLGQVITIEGVTETRPKAGSTTETETFNKRYIVVEVDCESRYDGKTQVSNYTTVTIIPEGNNPLPLPAGIPMVINAGAQPAVVVDATDPRRIGRVRVRYHWQGDDSDATPWIRVATPFTSFLPESKDGDDDTGDAGAGMFNQLNKGDEVMVDYENQNIERPYVVGSLYGGNRQEYGRQTPYGGRNYSHIFRSRYGHMIGIREPANTTGIVTSIFPGLKLFSWIPGFSAMVKAQPSEKTRQALGGFDICDNNGLYSISTSSDSRNISISSPWGTVGIDAAMGITVSAPNGNIKIVGKNVDIIAGNNLTLKSGENISNSFLTGSLPSYIYDSKKSDGEKAWDFFSGRMFSPLVDSLVGVFNIPALRFCIELLIRPVQGSLKIHSGRHLMLEAGGKSAAMPASTFKPHYYNIPDGGNRFTQINNLKADIYIPLEYFKACLMAYAKAYRNGYSIKASIVQYISTNINVKKGSLTNDAAIKTAIDPLLLQNGEVTLANVKSALFDNPDGITKQQNKAASKVLDDIKQCRATLDKKNYKPIRSANQYFHVPQANGDVFYDPTILLATTNSIRKFENALADNQEASLLVDDYKTLIQKKIYSILSNYITSGENHKLLKKAADLAKTQAGQYDYSGNNWNTFVDGITPDPDFDDGLGAGFQEYWRNDVGLKIANKLVPEDTIEFLASWNPESSGQILYSYPDKTNRILGNDANECAGKNTEIKDLKELIKGTFL